MNQIKDRVKKIISDTFCVDDIQDDDTLIMLGGSSLYLIEFFYELSKEFGNVDWLKDSRGEITVLQLVERIDHDSASHK